MRALKRLLMRAVSAWLARSSRASSDVPPQRWRRVLFLRHDRIGDMILSTGVIHAIARSSPTLRVDVLASPINAPVLEHDTVAHAIIFDKRRPWNIPRLLRQLRRARYDAVIDCMVTAPSLTTLLLMLASGAPWRIGVAGRGLDAAITHPVPPYPRARHMVQHLSALSSAFGATAPEGGWRPELELSSDERARAERVWVSSGHGTPRVLVNVSAGTASRRWPDERYVQVLRHVQAAMPDAQLRVVSSPAERSRAEHIARGANATPTSTPRLRDAIALVATADLVITPDTSIAHAASALGTPAVAMYRPGSVEAWGLYGTEGVNVLADGDLDSLPVERVLPAIDRMLRAIADEPGRVPARPRATVDEPAPRPLAPKARESGATIR